MLSVKLHRAHIEVAHFIGTKRGKLVSMAQLKAQFPDWHNLPETLWTLIDQRVVVEDRELQGHYQLSRDGAADIDQQWEDLQAKIAKGEKVPLIPATSHPDDLKITRELEAAQAAKKAAAAAQTPEQPKQLDPAKKAGDKNAKE